MSSRDRRPPTGGTLYRRISTLSSWFPWLDEEDVTVANPEARIRRPQRYAQPRPWLNRNEVTDLLTAAEEGVGDAYALACLLALNGLRVSEACGAKRQPPRWRPLPTNPPRPRQGRQARRDRVMNPRTQQAVDGLVTGPLLRNQRRRRMQPHNAAAVLRRQARKAGITQRVTPNALRRSYITIGLLQGVPLRDMQRAARHSKPTAPWATTNPSDPYTRTRPSSWWPPPPDNLPTAGATGRFEPRADIPRMHYRA